LSAVEPGIHLIPFLNQGAIIVGFVICSSDVLLLYAYVRTRLRVFPCRLDFILDLEMELLPGCCFQLASNRFSAGGRAPEIAETMTKPTMIAL